MMKQCPSLVILRADQFQRDAHFVEQPRESGNLVISTCHLEQPVLTYIYKTTMDPPRSISRMKASHTVYPPFSFLNRSKRKKTTSVCPHLPAKRKGDFPSFVNLFMFAFFFRTNRCTISRSPFQEVQARKQVAR